MTTTLNATTSNGLVVTPDNSGNVLLQYNGVAAPAFSAYKSSNQSITSNTWTKITFDTEEFDTANCFTSSTFTPTVAGYYQVNGAADLFPSTGTATRSSIRIYKNGGSFYKAGNEVQISNTTEMSCVVSVLIYMNGTTDYLELYALQTGTSPTVAGSQGLTYFQACLLRGA
jgi:hypothetical protein